METDIDLDLGARQGPTAGCLVIGRLRGGGDDAADRRREPVRGARPAGGVERARRRGRQRQRDAGGGPPLVRRDVDRLRPGAAGIGASPRAGRGARGDVPAGRRREAAVRGRLVRRRGLHLRRHVHARPATGGAGAGPRLQTGRPDRPRQLDAGQLRRAAVQVDRPVPAASGRRQIAGAVGDARAARRAVRRGGGADPGRRSASSCFATAHRSTGSRSSAPTTAPSTGPSPRSTPRSRRSSPATCSRCWRRATGRPIACSRFRASTWRW